MKMEDVGSIAIAGQSFFLSIKHHDTVKKFHRNEISISTDFRTNIFARFFHFSFEFPALKIQARCAPTTVLRS